MQRVTLRAALLGCLAFLAQSFAPTYAAPIAGAAGPYRVQVTTEPSPVPVGPAKLRIHLADSGGTPVAGATLRVLTQMPGMPMGEHVEEAQPVAGKPGDYEAPANFQMAGGWGSTSRWMDRRAAARPPSAFRPAKTRPVASAQ